MEPRHWGRAVWTVIFIVIALAELDGNLELCKRRLYIVCSTLPCVACRGHALEAVNANDVMSSDDLNYVYFFFMRLFNNLASDPRYRIDISKVRPLRWRS
ncbi:putative redox protein [Squirrelpox virus]|uniref:thiol oxidase n=1 Tax=Squirrelpox virus TaxID=240426 RepID=U3UBG5_9POXV|nr:putative redox protein [Squirrelpox virus]CCD83216.1 putative redox protein [Squirrelpox virus]